MSEETPLNENNKDEENKHEQSNNGVFLIVYLCYINFTAWRRKDNAWTAWASRF